MIQKHCTVESCAAAINYLPLIILLQLVKLLDCLDKAICWYWKNTSLTRAAVEFLTTFVLAS
jgi:hypothetical protein